jgi:thiol-disulfide isomerase/thioredoxin
MRLAALLALALSAAPASPAPPSRAAIQDDLPAALAAARARKVPLLVEVWAPWCPSCRYMRAHVLEDPRVARLSARFVWLDVDTEGPRAAPFLERYPIDAWPTLLVVDPATEKAVVRWSGTATAAEVERLALDGERMVKAERATRAGEALARADALLAERRHAEAAAAFRAALAQGGPDWTSRPRAAEALLQALSFAGDPAACVAGAKEALPALSGSARVRGLAMAISCATDLPDARARERALDGLEPQARRALEDRTTLADDRSSLWEALAGGREARGDAKGARAAGRAWLADVEQETARARTPLERAALDGQRLDAALRAGAPGRVLAALQRSEADLPEEFVPAAHLAVLYLALDRPRDALAAADRALARAEGPRRIRILVGKARALDALGNRVAARETLQRALSDGAALPEAVRPRRPVADAEQLLKTLGGGAD